MASRREERRKRREQRRKEREERWNDPNYRRNARDIFMRILDTIIAIASR